MDVQEFRSLTEFQAARAPHLAARLEVERLMARDHAEPEAWKVPGWCDACGAARHFLIDWQWCDHRTPNYRERLECDGCHLNNRQRFVAGFVRRLAEERRERLRDVYLYEQVTHFHTWITAHYPRLNIQASEFLGFQYAPGQVVNGVRHEDALNLSFADASLDLIVSNDVYEHVPDYRRALQEAARVLRPEGRLVVSTPFFDGAEETVQRAILTRGQLVHLLPEVYHGNPVDEKGSLVFFDYGWDLLEGCRNAGFADACVLGYYSLFRGHIGGGMQLIVVATR